MSANTPVAQPAQPRRKALICGVGGQDGAYLAQFLLKQNYHVVGTSRDANAMPLHNLMALGIRGQIDVASMAPDDFRSVLRTVVRFEPDEIYNLAGQTSVGLSFEQPVEAIESIALSTLNMLESIRFVQRPIRFYNAGSGECFGETNGTPATEMTPFRPRSPYAVAKVCAHNLVANYREAYQLHACTGILFNHESALRPERFVTQKIVRAACRIAHGSAERLRLGNLDIERDWGWAPEYVQAMWKMLQTEQPHDILIATGQSMTLQRFVELAFEHFGLRWLQHVQTDPTLLRPSDVAVSTARPRLAAELLNWRAALTGEQIVKEMCVAAQAQLAQELALKRRVGQPS